MNSRYSVEQLSQLVGLSRRTVRYYVQQNVLDRPEGVRRGAYYTDEHLQKLLQIKEWQSAGYSLDRIRELQAKDLNPSETLLPLLPKRGEVSVCSHIHLSPGVKLQLKPNTLLTKIKSKPCNGYATLTPRWVVSKRAMH